MEQEDKIDRKPSTKSLKRLEVIERCKMKRLNEGWTRLQIKDWIVNEIGYSEVEAYRLMRQVGAEIDELAEQTFRNSLEETVAKFEVLYQIHMKNRNYKGAESVLDKIAKLKGHYTSKVDLGIDAMVTGITLSIVKNEDGTKN